MGHTSSDSRTTYRIHTTPTPQIFHIPATQATSQQRKVPHGHSGLGCCRNHSTRSRFRQRKGILLQPFHGSQERRLTQTNSRPKIAQPSSQALSFQDGINTVCTGSYGIRRILNSNRCQRSIPTHTHSSGSSQVSQILCSRTALAVRSTPLRTIFRATHLHQGDGSSTRGTQTPGNHGHSLFGRSARKRPVTGDCRTTYHTSPRNPNQLRLAHQLQQVQPASVTNDRIPGSGPRFQEGKGLPPNGQDQDPSEPHSSSPAKQPSPSQNSHADSRHHGCILPSNPLCTVPHENITTVDTETTEEGSTELRPQGSHPDSSKTITRLVVPPKSGTTRKTLPQPLLDGAHNRCQSQRLGRSTGAKDCTRGLEPRRKAASHQSARTKSDPPLSSKTDTLPAGQGSEDTIRQRHSGGIYKSPGGHQKPNGSIRSEQDSELGRNKRSSSVGSTHSRCRKLDSGLLEQGDHRSGRVEPSPRSLSAHCRKVGATRHRPHGIQAQPQGPKVRSQKSRSTSSRSRCSGDSVGLSTDIHISPTGTASKGHQEGKEGEHNDHTHRTTLAQKVVVCGHSSPGKGQALSSSTKRRSAGTRSHSPSIFSSMGFNGMALEALILKRTGAPSEAIPTMLRARKPVSAKIYYRVWKTFISWCELKGLHPRKASETEVLSFLQEGLTKGLAVSSLKVQVSALSIFFQEKLALKDNIRTFLQGATRLAPPYRLPVPPWDLNLVLNVLQDEPYEPLDSIPLTSLTEKVSFLLAITSARRVSELAALSCESPFTIIHQDKVVLRPTPDFLPKVVTAFHLNQDIVVPSLCPLPKNPIEKRLHNLDVVRAITSYLEETKDIRRSQALFIIPTGPNRGAKASKALIAKWIRSTIIRAYAVKGRASPLKVKAHSTRSLSTSWALQHQASAEQICKAATWASLHTFTRFYRLHTQASAEASFGRKVLQTVIS